ncbi:hypothetical protein N7522_006435 [Penicillium canescens]|nr:hypothetical protein N7522_006435 [Penicillium canescens]
MGHYIVLLDICLERLCERDQEIHVIKAFQDHGVLKADKIATLLFLVDIEGEQEQYAIEEEIALEGFRVGSEQRVWLQSPLRGYWSENTETILCYAAENGQTEIVNKVLTKCPTVKRENAISFALASGQLKVLKLFKDDLDGEINWPPSLAPTESSIFWRLTPLAYASSINDLELIRFLAKQGCDANGQCFNGSSPLAIAEDEALECLLKARCVGMGPRSADGTNPMHIAAVSHNRKAMQRFLNKGADINAQRVDGWTPLMCYVYFLDEPQPSDLEGLEFFYS